MLWPEVSNRPVRLCLEAAFNLCACNLGSYDGDYLANRGDRSGVIAADLLAYRDLVRRALANSGLAQCLPAGLELLPAPEEALPGWAQPVFKVYRPRSYRQLIDHLGDFLPQYLRLPDGEQRSIKLLQRRAVKLLGTAGALGLSIGLRLLPAVLAGTVGNLVFMAPFAPLLLMLFFVALDPKRNDDRRQIHLAELYFYLRRELADQGEADGAARFQDMLRPRRYTGS